MAWTDLNFTVGQVLTAAQMNNLVANLTAMMDGDSGAPRLKPAAVLPTVGGGVESARTGASSNGATTPTKVNEIKIPYSGELRVDFGMSRGGTPSVFGQIYINGVATGILRSTSSTSTVIFSELFTGLLPGDLIQLFTYVSSGSGLVNTSSLTLNELSPNSTYSIIL